MIFVEIESYYYLVFEVSCHSFEVLCTVQGHRALSKQRGPELTVAFGQERNWKWSLERLFLVLPNCGNIGVSWDWRLATSYPTFTDCLYPEPPWESAIVITVRSAFHCNTIVVHVRGDYVNKQPEDFLRIHCRVAVKHCWVQDTIQRQRWLPVHRIWH